MGSMLAAWFDVRCRVGYVDQLRYRRSSVLLNRPRDLFNRLSTQRGALTACDFAEGRSALLIDGGCCLKSRVTEKYRTHAIDSSSSGMRPTLTGGTNTVMRD